MIFFLVLLANFLSLFWVVKAHKIGLEVLLKNPAFLIGDFLLIPIYFSLVAKFLTEKMAIFSLLEIAASVVLALLVVMMMGKLFDLLKFEWIFHGFVAWLALFILFLVVDVVIREPGYWLFLCGMGLILVLNQILGAIFPKKL